MRKFIDAKRLRANIEALIAGTPSDWIGAPAAIEAYKDVLNSIELLQEEQPSLPSNLEEAAEKYVSTLCDRADEGLRIDTTLESAFKAGAKCQKEQLMKEAETAIGTVFTNPKPMNIIVENEQWEKLLGQFDNGQRVRIILVKEDAE